MSSRVSVGGRALDLPPPYGLIALREAGDAFAHACAIASDEGAGALVWVPRYDLAEFAVVLEPTEPLVKARLAIYAGIVALADALAVLAPPSRPISLGWPDAMRIDGVLVGGGRLGWPPGIREDQVPDWLVFAAMVRTAVVNAGEPGMRPVLGALDELGFEAIDAGELVSSFCRHLMKTLHGWNETGVSYVVNQWLERSARKRGRAARIDGNGELMDALGEKRHLADALMRPSWLDPDTSMPWLREDLLCERVDPVSRDRDRR